MTVRRGLLLTGLASPVPADSRHGLAASPCSDDTEPVRAAVLAAQGEAVQVQPDEADAVRHPQDVTAQHASLYRAGVLLVLNTPPAGKLYNH